MEKLIEAIGEAIEGCENYPDTQQLIHLHESLQSLSDANLERIDKCLLHPKVRAKKSK